jgi:hypothetical protein
LTGHAIQGCDTVYDPPLCELHGEKELTLWLPARATDKVTVRADRSSLETQQHIRADGLALTFRVPKGAREISITHHGDPERAYSFAVVHTASTAQSLAKKTFEAGRVENRASHPEKALELLDRAARLAMEGPKKEVSVALRARTVATFIAAFTLGESTKAALLLNAAPEPGPLDGEGLVRLRIHQAQLDSRLADVRGSLGALDEAERWSVRFHDPALLYVKESRALAFSKLGRHDDAARLINEVVKQPLEDQRCVRAGILSNAAWIEILRKNPDAPISAWLEEARHIYRDCESDKDENDVLVNIAAFELSRGDREKARAALAEIKGEEFARSRMWRILIDAQIDQSLEKLETLRIEAEKNTQPELAWRARIEAGALEEKQGRLEQARAHYESAEELALLAGESAPFGDGRLALREDRGAGADGLVRIFLAQEKPADAMRAARMARRRTLLEAAEVIDDPDRWCPALDDYHRVRARLDGAITAGWGVSEADRERYQAELATLRTETRRALDTVLQKRALPAMQHFRAGEPLGPAENEAIFVTWPLGQVYYGFLQTRRGSFVVSTTKPAAETWVELLSEPLAKVSRLRVIAGNDDGSLQLHNAIFFSEPMLKRLSVVYSTDLPPRTTSPEAPRVAFIAADAQRDLSRAREEAREVEKHLLERGWKTEAVLGESASRSKVLSTITRVSLFHYAGHGHFAGGEGFDSALQLSGGELNVGEILTATGAPSWVILSSCDTGKNASTARSTGLGVASAFLIAGARAVIASDVSIGDARAARFMSSLYEEWPGPQNIEDAYRKAMLGAGAESASFRLLVR